MNGAKGDVWIEAVGGEMKSFGDGLVLIFFRLFLWRGGEVYGEVRREDPIFKIIGYQGNVKCIVIDHEDAW